MLIVVAGLIISICWLVMVDMADFGHSVAS
jgi:hypothetical protein